MSSWKLGHIGNYSPLGRLREDVRQQGYLYKTGPSHKSFDKRWCVLEHGSLTYYLTEKSTTGKGSINRQCVHGIQETSVEKQQYAFEISTNKASNRLYLFAAENEGEKNRWMQSLSKLICPGSIMKDVAMMEFSLGGNYYVKDNFSEDWRKSWLMLSWKLLYYMDQNQKLETVDLTKASSIKYQEMDRGCRMCTETGQHFVIHAPNKALYIQADLVRDTEKLFAACEKAMKGRMREDVRHQGYLYKTGPKHTTLDKRWCVLEHGALTYYLTEQSTTAKGSIDQLCIHGIQETSVETQQYAFEISTNKASNRLYLFAAENEGEKNRWMQSLSKLICPLSIMEHVGMMEFSLGGNYYVKDNLSEDWRKSWLMLSWRLLFYMDQDQMLEMVDLRKAISIKYQEMDRGCRKCTETGQHFVINATNKALHIQADLVRDTEKLFAACEKAAKVTHVDHFSVCWTTFCLGGRMREDVRHQGYLYKTGPKHTSFDKRWCVLEHGSLTYYLTEKSTTAKGSIDQKCIHGILETSVEKQQYAFEISTNKASNRLYLFAAENEGEKNRWMQSLSKLICPGSIMKDVGVMEFSLGGNYYVKDNFSEDWRKSWLMLSWRLLYYMDQNQKLETVDLRKASSIKYQEMDRGCRMCTETGQHFVINATNRALYIQADLVRDTEKLFAACEKAMKESGRTLQDQQLTSDDVPVIVNRCIDAITMSGLKSKGHLPGKCNKLSGTATAGGAEERCKRCKDGRLHLQ
ncbi:uncharacterized protein LOC124282161 [Haliotis rubra]|uniref:uncharacterized protein LOC124282161 n=1 Tax=Haliotis rubra TaxID=36100 RepID=UPI001EE4F690|nr:uncharacterized protein LOC124282161 [Haliotis rubra]